MKNAFYIILTLFILNLNMFELLSWLFGHVEKRLDNKEKVNFQYQ